MNSVIKHEILSVISMEFNCSCNCCPNYRNVRNNSTGVNNFNIHTMTVKGFSIRDHKGLWCPFKNHISVTNNK